MTHKIGEKGQVVIPKAIRDELGLKAGMPVDFELLDNGVFIREHQNIRSLAGMFQGSGMASQLLEDRAHEPR